jgi:dTDP-4-dehydrorhamnose reductase
MDLDSVDSLETVFDQWAVDVVINAAAMTDIEACELNPEKAHYVNVVLATNLARAATRKGVKFVHISSDHLYDGADAMRSEDAPVLPVNRYARTKADAEISVLNCCAKALIIRTNFYGWGTSYRHSFSDIILRSLRSGQEVSLFKDVYYTPIFVDTLIDTVDELLLRDCSGIFNVVGDQRLSKYDFGIELATRFGLNKQLVLKCSLSDRHDLVARPLDLSLSNRKICNILGRPLGTVSDHVTRMLQKTIPHAL